MIDCLCDETRASSVTTGGFRGGSVSVIDDEWVRAAPPPFLPPQSNIH